jgi:MinD superfamily P-loop ATPase
VGTDPLQKKVTIDTNMYGEAYINLNDFLILAHISSNNQFKKVIIANKNESEYMANYTERIHNNYQKTIVKGVPFYKQTSKVKSR